MAIGSALQKSYGVHVYDEKGKPMFTKSGTLVGYTSTTVSVKKGTDIYTYNEKGVNVYTKAGR